MTWTLDVPRYQLVVLANTYSESELREILHNAELKEHVAKEFDDPTLGFWQQAAETYRQAIGFRRQIDQRVSALRSRSRLARKKVARIDFQAVKDRIDIVDFIGRYVELKKSGSGYFALCPFHMERTPSFYVWPKIQAFKCFGCGAKGDVITFARMMGVGND